MSKPNLTEILGIEYPIIQAPMFLVSNVPMAKAALDSGITSCIPALNYRTIPELKDAIKELKEYTDKPFGINLIVNKSNVYYKKQLMACLDEGVDYFITSLGKPKEVIEEAHKIGAKVFCDIVNKEMAKKVEDLGCDAIIAVGSEAGGHSGKIPSDELIPMMNETVEIPVISAGGVGTHEHFKRKMELGAAGVSVGTIFIASKEADVSQEYKQAVVDYGEKDIIWTTKLSGTPCSVINTPYVQKIGTEQSWLEKLVNRNKTLKKYAKMLIAKRGFDSLRKAAFSATYKTVWCAGPTVEYVDEIRSVEEIVNELIGKQKYNS